MKKISSFIEGAIGWAIDHADFTKSMIAVWHFAITGLFWTLFDTAVGLSVFAFAWSMLVLGQLWYALPPAAGKSGQSVPLRVIRGGSVGSLAGVGEAPIAGVSMTEHEYMSMRYKLGLLQWCSENFSLIHKSDVTNSGVQSFTWQEVESNFTKKQIENASKKSAE